MPNTRLNGQNFFLQALNGRHVYAGVVIATTVKNNADTATPFVLDAGQALLIQPDTACYVGVGDTAALASTAASSTAGLKLAADEKYILTTYNEAFIAATAVSGTSNLKVWLLK